MAPEEYRSFMTDVARTGKLATVRAGGRPHVAPIWFDMDGDALIFMTYEKSVKGKNILRDGRVSICVDDDKPPFSFVVVEGQAEILSPSPEEFLEWSTRIGGRYMGPDQAEAFGRRNAVPGELLLRVQPTKIIARHGVAD
ncbi:MAG: PPOX class F420-dependent oxidoreductase [Chloroflexi bacterium]|nr:PPOX class F420-dependent oxidoreductase [Chloroflexota bacterium]